MTQLLLTTKLYFPPPRSNLVPRRRLVERLESGLQGSLSCIGDMNLKLVRVEKMPLSHHDER